jgi:hypothetical protein
VLPEPGLCEVSLSGEFMTRLVFILMSISIFLLSGAEGCSPMDKDVHASGKTIQQVQEENTSQWMAIPGVEGTAIGLYKGKPCIKIFSSKKTKDLRAVIPSTVDGYPVIIEETGTFRSLERQ